MTVLLFVKPPFLPRAFRRRSEKQTPGALMFLQCSSGGPMHSIVHRPAFG